MTPDEVARWDYDRQAEHFHRDNHARAMALVAAYRTEDGDLPGWKALTDDLFPPLPPASNVTARAEAVERQRRVTATLLAMCSLCSRTLDVAFADPDVWLEDQRQEVLRGVAEEP